MSKKKRRDRNFSASCADLPNSISISCHQWRQKLIRSLVKCGYSRESIPSDVKEKKIRQELLRLLCRSTQSVFIYCHQWWQKLPRSLIKRSHCVKNLGQKRLVLLLRFIFSATLGSWIPSAEINPLDIVFKSFSPSMSYANSMLSLWRLGKYCIFDSGLSMRTDKVT